MEKYKMQSFNFVVGSIHYNKRQKIIMCTARYYDHKAKGYSYDNITIDKSMVVYVYGNISSDLHNAIWVQELTGDQPLPKPNKASINAYLKNLDQTQMPFSIVHALANQQKHPKE